MEILNRLEHDDFKATLHLHTLQRLYCDAILTHLISSAGVSLANMVLCIQLLYHHHLLSMPWSDFLYTPF